MTLEQSQTMLVVLLVVGLAVGAGIGYFMAPSDGGYDRGYDEGYNEGYETASANAPWGADPPDDFSRSDYVTKESVSSLKNFMWGAVGFSLVSAIAAVVCLTQVSKRFQ